MKSLGKQQRSRQTIQTILDAAVQVLIDEGFEKATTNKIASRAGYSVGTLYHYFEDKDDIYGNIIDQTLLNLTELSSHLTIQPTLYETLHAWLELMMTSLEQDPAKIQALQNLLTGKFREKRQSVYGEIIAFTVRLLEAHRSEIVVEDLELAAGVIVAATIGFTISENASLLQPVDMVQHILRLQFAYLTLEI